MAEEKRRVNAAIDKSLYENVMQLGYSISEAITLGFEKLLEAHREDFEKVDTNIQEDPIPINSQEIEGYKLDIAGYKENVKALNVEIARLKEVLSNAPDPAELADIKARFEERQRLIDEKDKRIEALEREVSRLDMFAHYFKNVETKLIEAPAAEKKRPWYKFW
jgi:predicted RNase H-like nuclease (RuvC/YqgF family)